MWFMKNNTHVAIMHCYMQNHVCFCFLKNKSIEWKNGSFYLGWGPHARNKCRPLGSDKNKAGYTAAPVACGWAGTIFGVSGAFGQEQHGQKTHKRRKIQVWRTNRRTDRRMDQRTDRPTKQGVESRSTRLKRSLGTLLLSLILMKTKELAFF